MARNKGERDRLQEKEFDVEAIVGHQVHKDNGKTYYEVKWEGYSSDQNTMEPTENLEGSQDLLKKYWESVVREKTTRKRKATTGELLDNFGTSSKRLFKTNCIPELEQSGTKLLNVQPTDSNQYELLLKVDMKERAKWRDQKLAEWAKEMRDIDGPKEAPISVENSVDFEIKPGGFNYVKDYVYHADVQIPKLATIYCSHNECSLKSANECCPHQEDAEFPYYDRRLVLQRNRPINECNDQCHCDPEKCQNRVIQKGRQFPLCIFRTKNKGWGLKAIGPIPKNTFICQYVGEVVTEKEAEKRGRIYDALGCTYLFDLDFSDHLHTYTVDAGRFGNASHFINHSCDPNLTVWAAYFNCPPDRTFHRLALFACKDIAAGEELSFDYLNRSSPEKRGRKGPKKNGFKCLCGTKKCRKSLFM